MFHVNMFRKRIGTPVITLSTIHSRCRFKFFLQNFRLLQCFCRAGNGTRTKYLAESLEALPRNAGMFAQSPQLS